MAREKDPYPEFSDDFEGFLREREEFAEAEVTAIREDARESRDVLARLAPMIERHSSHEMQSSVSEMMDYVLSHDTGTLIDFWHKLNARKNQMIGQLRAGTLSERAAADAVGQVRSVYRTQARTLIIGDIVTATYFGVHDSSYNLKEMQERALATEALTLDERLLWCGYAAKLLPDQQGINLRDKRAVTEARQFTIIRVTQGQEAKARDRTLRRLGAAVATTIYNDMGIVHDDLGRITADLLEVVISRERLPDVRHPERALDELYRRIDEMKRPEIRLAADKILAAIRKMRDEH